MSTYTVIKSMPGDPKYFDFEDFPKHLYETISSRFKIGNDPITSHLTGCYVMYYNNKAVGRFALYNNPNLKYNECNTATIGSYECIDDLDVSRQLLTYAQSLLKKEGCQYIIGPMEGSTWELYRFSDHNDAPNFFMEPYHKAYYKKQFLNAGFETIAQYHSSLVETITCDTKAIEQKEKDYIRQGLQFRPIDMSKYTEELHKISPLCIQGFTDNFLYTPISVTTFVSKYQDLAPYIDPELILIAEDSADDIQAVLFCIKDHFDLSNNTVIIKSLVRKKTNLYKGLGHFLTEKITAIALQKGCNQIIHALMINDNRSQDISKKLLGNPYKSYSLFGQKV